MLRRIARRAVVVSAWPWSDALREAGAARCALARVAQAVAFEIKARGGRVLGRAWRGQGGDAREVGLAGRAPKRWRGVWWRRQAI